MAPWKLLGVPFYLKLLMIYLSIQSLCAEAAYGTDRFIPKAHYALHLPAQLARHGFLLQCFTQERKHKEVKRWSNTMETSKEGIEQHILGEVVLTHLSDLETWEPGVLQGAWKPAGSQLVALFCRDFHLSVLSSTLYVSETAARTSRGDMVALPDAVAELWFHIKYASHYLSRIAVHEQAAAGPNIYKLGRSPMWIRTCDIRGPCIYRKMGPDHIQVAPELFFGDVLHHTAAKQKVA